MCGPVAHDALTRDPRPDHNLTISLAHAHEHEKAVHRSILVEEIIIIIIIIIIETDALV